MSLSRTSTFTETQTILPSYDDALQTSVTTLNGEISNYDATEEQADVDEKVVEKEAQRVVVALRQVGDAHADPVVREEWHQRAEDFSSGSKAKRQVVLKHAKKAANFIMYIPCMQMQLTCCMVHAAGNAVTGVGRAVFCRKQTRSGEKHRS